jgi:hypothetical protein
MGPRKFTLALIFAIGVSAASCGDSDLVVVQVNGEPDTLAITIINEADIVVETLQLEMGDTAYLDALATDSVGDPLGEIDATWQSTNPGVASVSQQGVVRALAVGTTNIVASYDDLTVTVPTSVTSESDPPPPPPPPPPTPQGIVFHSDWSTALGNGDQAKRDTNKPRPWTMSSGPRLSEVVPSNGLGFPTTNAFFVGTSGQGDLLRTTSIPVPNVGESLYYRVYFRVVAPSGLPDAKTHPIQDGNAIGDVNWAFRVFTNTPGDTWDLNFFFNNNSGGWDLVRPPNLDKNVTYRIEWQVHRTGANTFRFHAWVYDSAGRLLYDDADFRNSNSSGSLADQHEFNFHRVENLNGLNAGINGGVGTPGDTWMYYQAGMAVCSGAPCGPYTSAEAGP